MQQVLYCVSQAVTNTRHDNLRIAFTRSKWKITAVFIGFFLYEFYLLLCSVCGIAVYILLYV